MSGPFLCYRECIPPTSVDTAKFFTCAGYGDFLITLTSGAISVYRVHLSSKDGGHGAHFSLVLHLKVFGKPFDVNIFNPSEFTGDESGNAPDQCYVILNFDSGKISISKFDPSRCSLEIAALFNAEEEAIGAGSEVHAHTQGRQISPGVGSSPFLIVDIQDSIACTLLYGQQLFFVDLSSFGDHDSNGISIMNPSVLLQSKLGVAQGKADSSSKQFIIDIQLSLRLLGPVLDYCFLPGYSHPALAVLQERGPLPAGHAATTRHTCCLSVLAVDKVTQTVSLLWRQLMLPHDSICIVPLIHSSDFGSVALITMNAVLLVSQEGVTGVSTCGFASTTVSSHITLQPSKLPTGLELDASRWIESDRGCLVGSLKDGRLMSVKFQTAESPVKDIFFSVSLIASSIRCSCFCMNVSGNLWFLGSRLSDCLLISVTQPPSGTLDPSHSIPLDSMKLLTGTSSSAKRVKRMSFDHSSSSSNSDFFCGDDCSVAVRDNIDEEENSLYGKILNPHLSNLNKIGVATHGLRTLNSTSTPASSSALSLHNSDVSTESLLCTKYSLKVTDTIPVLGPVLDGMFCGNDESIDQLDKVEWNRVGMPLSKTMPNPASAYIVDREAKDSLHLYTGLDEESGIYRVARGIRVSKLASRNFPGATGVHCLPASNRLYSLLFINFVDKSRLFLCHTSGLSKMTEDPIIPDNSTDKVFLPSDLSLKEISCADAGFIATEATIAIGMLFEFVAVQVVSQCVRVVIMSAESGANGEALQDVFVCDDIELGGLGGSPGEHIVYADVCRSWVSLITSVGAVYLLEFDPSDETLVLRHSVQDFQSISIVSKAGEVEGEDIGEDEEKEVGEGRLREDIEGQGHALPSLSTFLTLSPIAASLFYGAFPIPSSTPASSSITVTSGKTTPSASASAAASASSSASEWAGTSQALYSSPSIMSQTSGKGQKNQNQQTVFETPSSSVSLSLSLPLSLPLPDTTSKIQELSALQKFKKAEALYLYGDSSFDCYTSSEEHESLDSDTQDPQNGEGIQNHVDGDRMEVVVDADEEGYTEFSHSDKAYQTPGKRKQNDSMEIDDSQAMIEMEVKDAIESMHVVFSDQYGTVKVIALDSLRCVFQADNICSLPKLIQLRYEPSDVSNDRSEGVGSPTPNTPHTPHTPITPRPPVSTPTAGSTTLDPTTETAPRAFRASERVLVDARLVMLGRTSAPSSLAKLTFVLVLESSDVVVYYLADQYRPDLNTSTNTKRKVSSVPRDAYFIKLEHAVVTRKRKNRLKKRNPALNINDATGANSKEYLREADDLCPQRIRVHHTDERTTVLVSGSRPVMICNDSGIPFLAPLGTPDLPFSNNGAYLLAPLSVGKVQGVASMWVENDDGFPPVPTGLSAAVTDSKKQSTLQLYQEVPGLMSYPGSVTTAKKMHSGVTTHHCEELLAKSEDNTEQALLKNRTYVLACSTEIKIPFLSAVLTDDEKDKEEKFYDRFFPSLESFTQPDPLVGAAPDMTTREHKLVIMQSGTAVDEYVLPAGEQVLGIEALYLTVTTSTVIPALFTSQAIVMEKKTKRVFFAACTCVEDKHGEDTQGEGRIMFFGLDYALFQDAVGDSNAAAEVKEIEEIVDGKSNTSAPSSSFSSSSTLLQSKPQQTPSTQPQTKSQQSSEQAKFFKAIQPKLKLLWTGPGPASIVKQIGEYILSTVSTTIYVYKLNSETMELDQITFFFAQFFISSISVMKNFIVIADVCNSIQFLVWREDDLTLTLVSKDMDSQTVLSTAFLSDGGSLGIVVGDDEANIQLMKFDPRKLETKDGSRLCCLADFHLGSDATLLLPHSMLMSPALLPVSLPRVLMTQPPLPPMPPPMPQMGLPLSLSLVPPPLPPQSMPPSRVARLRQSATSAVGQPFGQKLDKFSGTKSCVLVGTIDGGLGMLMPVEERMYRRLALLQQIMSMGVPTPCGLNPREYRVIKTTRFLTEKKKGILDGTLLWKYVSLEGSLQDELAAAMGVTTDTILESLLELDLLGSFF